MSYQEILDSDVPVMFDFKTCLDVLEQHGLRDEFLREHNGPQPYDARYILAWLGY